MVSHFISFALGCMTAIALTHCESTDEWQYEEELQLLRQTVGQLSRQALLTQLHIEERVRSEGDSGLKQVRHYREGTRTYHSDSVHGRAFAAMHEHANHVRTIGMGEVVAVLNGVDFRTRHNDYILRMPSTTSQDYKATELIPFPEVPPSVLEQSTIEDQIQEMREWFKAWQDQDRSTRDYTQYFKPVLCYMEGMWTVTDDSVDESFESDRHFLEADTWFELDEKVRFQALTGSKGSRENIAYLPRAVINVTAEGYPVIARWNYNILCHPLSNDVPLDRFRVVDDLSARMRDQISLERYANTRLARFQLNTVDETFSHDSEQRLKYLDSLMYQIPGKNNYGAYFEDMGLEKNLYMESKSNAEPLNSGFYHRNYFVQNRDAMGQQFRSRGFADKAIYMAQTDHSEIAGIDFTICQRDNCRVVSQKWTYAIPLEIIYLTPLSAWNPYDIPFRTFETVPRYHAVTANGRNGKQGSAYDGTNSKNFYQTPYEFYADMEEDEGSTDPADTNPSGAVFVLDSQGQERMVQASGHRIFLPKIEGLGMLRQRYPIAPVHAEGSMLWKEVDALKQVALDPLSHGHVMYRPVEATDGEGVSESDPIVVRYRMRRSNANAGEHEHVFSLTQSDATALREMRDVTVTSSQDEGHSHLLVVWAVEGSLRRLKYRTCDGRVRCWDGHAKQITFVSKS